MKTNSRGFTLIEIVGATIIIAILTIAGVNISSGAVYRSRIDAATMDLQIFATDMEAVLEDIGVVDLKTSDKMDYKTTKIKEYLHVIEKDYTHTTFNLDTLDVSASRFTIETYELLDPWNNHYRLTYNTDRSMGKPGTCILASAGPNRVFEDDGYPDGVFGDDILVVITPRMEDAA